ncbi:MAG: flagellar motor switch protein FliG [Acidimicrobiales bacterium]
MMATIADPAKLDQLARVLVAIGEDRAAAIVQTFPPDSLPAIAEAMSQVPELSEEEVAEVLETMVDVLNTPPTPSGDMRYVNDVIERAFGAETAADVREALDPARRPFGFLSIGDPAIVARAISKEPIGVLALALASLDSGVSSKILKYFEPDAQAELHIRIATISPVSEQLLLDVESDLRARITPLIQPDGVEEIPGMEVVVDILGQASKKLEKRILDQIAERDEDLALKIREALFVFEDIAVLDNRAIQEILKVVDTSDLSLALYPAEEAVREKFMSNLSTRARENLAEEIEFLRNPAAGDMRAAQKRIVAEVRALEESGAITIDRGGDDDDDDE